MVITGAGLALLAGILATAIGGTATGMGAVAKGTAGMQDDGKTFKTREGWFKNTSNSDVADAFRQYMLDQGASPEFVNQLSSGQIAALLKENYKDGGWNVLGIGNTRLDFEDAYNDALKMQNVKPPSMPDYNSIYDQAQQTIAAENAEVEALYDQLLTQQTANLNSQMSDLNKSYQDTTNQILSNDYIKNRQF